MTAYVGIVGEVDMMAEPALVDAIDRLTALTPHTVDVDLSAVTFCGASLANFFARVHNVSPVARRLSRTALPRPYATSSK
jgi:hypothetical protein